MRYLCPKGDVHATLTYLSMDKVVGAEHGANGAAANGIQDSGLQVDENGAGHVLAIAAQARRYSSVRGAYFPCA